MSDPPYSLSSVRELAGKVAVHQHLCVIYATLQEQFSSAVPFLKIGLDRGEKCLYIADGSTPAAIVNALREETIDVDAAIGQGALTITNRGIYPGPGNFDPDRMIRFFADSVRAARSEGYPALRVSGEMTWVTGIDPHPERLMKFEAELNSFCRDHDFLCVCQYDRKRFPPQVLLEILRTHPTVVYGGLVCENPYYVPPEEYLNSADPEREIERLLARVRDDTAKSERMRQSEQQIRELSEKRRKETQALIDAIPQQIWSGPADGSNDFCNERLCSYTGLSLEEFRGKGWESIIHPDDRERVVRAWSESVAKGTLFEHEERHRRADGEYRWFLNRAVPVRDDEGRIVRWYGTNTDIEDRKQAELALQRAQAYLAMGERLAEVGTWAWSPSSGEMFGSDEFHRIFAFDPQTKITHEMFLQRIHPEDRSAYEMEFGAAVAEERDWDVEYRILLPNGGTKHIRGIGRRILNELGELSEFIGTARDVTESKRTDEELRRLSGRILQSQDEERRRIARELHDSTGQNLVALATMLSELRMSLPSKERKSRRLLSECKALTDRCIGEIRTLSYVLHPAALDQTGLAGAIRDYVRSFNKRNGIEVELELSPRVGRMARDVELALFRVVQESLTNIERHSGSQRARISMSRDSSLILEISDERDGNTESLPGSKPGPRFQFGVGIRSMQERVKLIGGRLEIDSTSRGTSVRVTLPLRNER